MSNFTDAKSFIVKAKKISKTRDVQILELLFDIKVNANGFSFQGWEITFIENPGNKIQNVESLSSA